MTPLTTITFVLLVTGFAFTLGGMLLRAVGRTGLILGAAIALTGHPAGLALVIISSAVWLAGQRHYSARHQQHRSPLARRLFTHRTTTTELADADARPRATASARHAVRRHCSHRRHITG